MILKTFQSHSLRSLQGHGGRGDGAGFGSGAGCRVRHPGGSSTSVRDGWAGACGLRALLVVLPLVGTDAGGTGRRDERIAVLYHLYREELVRLAIGMTGDISLAEETVQEAFARILSRRRALRDQQVAPCYLWRGVVAETRAVLRRRRAPSAGVAAGAGRVSGSIERSISIRPPTGSLTGPSVGRK